MFVMFIAYLSLTKPFFFLSHAVHIKSAVLRLSNMTLIKKKLNKFLQKKRDPKMIFCGLTWLSSTWRSTKDDWCLNLYQNEHRLFAVVVFDKRISCISFPWPQKYKSSNEHVLHECSVWWLSKQCAFNGQQTLDSLEDSGEKKRHSKKID